MSQSMQFCSATGYASAVGAGAVNFEWSASEPRWSFKAGSTTPEALWSLVMNAAAVGDVCNLEGLLPHAGSSCAEASLFVACEHGQLAVVRYLVELVGISAFGRSSEQIDEDLPTRSGALRCAVAFGHLHVVKFLTTATNTGYRNKDMRDLSVLAESRQHHIVASWLRACNRGWCPLHFA